MQCASSLTLRRFAAAAAAVSRPASLLVAGATPLPSVPLAMTRFLFQPAAPTAAALYAQRGYAYKAKVKAVSEDDEEDEFEAMGSDREFDGNFDDNEDLEDFDDDDEVSGSDDDDDCKPAQTRGRR